jgi:natural product precursor
MKKAKKNKTKLLTIKMAVLEKSEMKNIKGGVDPFIETRDDGPKP